jgi:hypothetical protein
MIKQEPEKLIAVAGIHGTIEIEYPERLQVAVRKLVTLDNEIRSGNFTAQTLVEYDAAYNDYINAGLPEPPVGIWGQIKERVGSFLRAE